MREKRDPSLGSLSRHLSQLIVRDTTAGSTSLGPDQNHPDTTNITGNIVGEIIGQGLEMTSMTETEIDTDMIETAEGVVKMTEEVTGMTEGRDLIPGKKIWVKLS